MPRLLLFDVDGTLVLTGRAGVRAMNRAFEDVFGVADGFAGLKFAGRTDFAIVTEAIANHDHSTAAARAAHLDAFRERYLEHLAQEIHADVPGKGVLPGVRELLDALAGREDAVCALLTGNYRDGARIKLSYFDLWRYFEWGAFGGDTGNRNDLLVHALAEAAGRGLGAFGTDDIVVIGDTPHDIACARSGGARSIGVATGPHGVEELLSVGATVALADLSDTRAVLQTLGLSAGPVC
jgi:phosphoglycolate phosphatase-like HAD superfamily hydrolase